jgi:hypothetical protein
MHVIATNRITPIGYEDASSCLLREYNVLHKLERDITLLELTCPAVHNVSQYLITRKPDMLRPVFLELFLTHIF